MENRRPTIGKYALDSLSMGMYNHPLMLIREYIQNSVDAIDVLLENEKADNVEARIDISVDGVTKSLRVTDNGSGVPAKMAKNVLHDIGKSSKKMFRNRGFRGIGRLGGLGYCEILRFTTKARGEKICSVSTWDCKKLRELINGNTIKLDASEVIDKVAAFSQHEVSEKIQEHFFTVELYNLKGSRNVLINVPTIKSYLSEVAPVPFDQRIFSFPAEIEKKLRAVVPKYRTYQVFVNGDQIFKPYCDLVPIGSKIKDKINGIEFMELKNGNNMLAFGWMAKLGLLGSISDSSFVNGLRLRSGNILIGDKDLLGKIFREKRFNGYLAGEFYTVDPGLIPNSRRDDFEDNDFREALFDSFIKNIGSPFSKKIREASVLRVSEKKKLFEKGLLETANDVGTNGYLSAGQKETIVTELEKLVKNANTFPKEIDDLLKRVAKSQHILDHVNMQISPKAEKMLKSICEIIFRKCTNKKEAEKIIKNIINSINKEN